jgi:rhodanese-related sulfurtransferase
MREGSLRIVLIVASAVLLLVPATALAQKQKRAKPKPKPARVAPKKVAAKKVAPKKVAPKKVAPKKAAPTEEEAEKKHVISTPAPFNLRVARRMSAEDVLARREEGQTITVVDTRSKFTGPAARGAVNLTDDKLAVWSKGLPKDTLIVAYCTCHDEHTAVRAVLKLQELGFTNAFALQGGLSAWQAVGLPVELAPATMSRSSNQ